jgi:hypothetical protein
MDWDIGDVYSKSISGITDGQKKKMFQKDISN